MKEVGENARGTADMVSVWPEAMIAGADPRMGDMCGREVPGRCGYRGAVRRWRRLTKNGRYE